MSGHQPGVSPGAHSAKKTGQGQARTSEDRSEDRNLERSGLQQERAGWGSFVTTRKIFAPERTAYSPRGPFSTDGETEAQLGVETTAAGVPG